MKRNWMLAVLCLLCALLLCSCGGSTAPAATPAPSEAPAETAAPAETPAPEESAPPVATLPDVGLVPDTVDEIGARFEKAKGFVGKPLSELTAAVGEPLSSSYASSCLVQGAEDGEHKYDGFTVTTVKNGNAETVQDVTLD